MTITYMVQNVNNDTIDGMYVGLRNEGVGGYENQGFESGASFFSTSILFASLPVSNKCALL